jgi:RNA polymerase sigma factor (TIGR02999 family)
MAPSEITARLLEARSGGTAAADRLFTAVYAQLKSLARRELRLGGRTPTLGATALVHEAYLRLVDQTRTNWNDRAHFFAVAARAMRQITIDHARRKAAAKRGSGGSAIPLEEEHAVGARAFEDVIAVDEALTRLAAESPRLVKVVELCFFAGLSVDETAEVVGTSPATVKRDWRKAKALLYAWIRQGAEPGSDPSADGR